MELIDQTFGPTIELERADIFTMKNEHSYAAFIGVLSNIFMKAHASSLYRKGPYIAAILVNKAMTLPYKNQPETSETRLVSLIPHLVRPKNGIRLGVFVYEESDMFSHTAKVGLKHVVSQCWPIQTFANRRNVSVNLPPSQLNSGSNKVRYFDRSQIRVPKNAQFVDYSTKNILSKLSKSKVHICYQGGTAWVSVAMSIPTIIVHPTKDIKGFHFKPKLFGQDLGNINILDENNLITTVRQHPMEHHVHISELGNKLREFNK